MTESLAAALDAGPVAPADLSSLPGLTVTAEPERRACRLRLVGRLDAETVPMFAACLTSWADRGRSQLVIDLSQLSDIDEAGATALAHATHVLHRAGGHAKVVAAPELLTGPLARRGLDVAISPEAPAAERHVR